MRPIIDNLEQLIDASEEERYENELELKDKIDELFDRHVIQTEALNFIRGRSFVKTYLIIDEAQNMTPNQAKSIITRAGKGTKIILLGDPNQIDKPFFGRADQRPELRLGKDEGQPPVLSDHHDGRRMRALRTGLRRRSAPVNIRKG